MRGARAPALVLAALVLTALATVGARRAGRAQEPGPRGALVTVRLEPDTVTLGQPFTVRIRVRASRNAAIRFPPVPDSGDAIEAIDPRAIEDAGGGDVLDRTAVYRLVAWDVGSRRATFGDVGVAFVGVEQRYAVRLPPVLVRSLLPADSALRVPKDVRAPVASQSGLWRYWLLLAVIAGGAAWYLWWRRRRRGATPVPEPEAFLAASAAFRTLDALALAEAGEPGRHLIAHVDVLRTFVARRFPLAAASLTGRELVAVLAASDFPVLRDRVGELLERETPVRYAGAAIAPAVAVALAREARAIVEEVQAAYDARLRAIDRGPRRPRRS